jgi:hypothetical protein
VSKGWRDPFNKIKRLFMPAFGDELSLEQIRDVITYLKSLWTPKQRNFQSEKSRGRVSDAAECSQTVMRRPPSLQHRSAADSWRLSASQCWIGWKNHAGSHLSANGLTTLTGPM